MGPFFLKNVRCQLRAYACLLFYRADHKEGWRRAGRFSIMIYSHILKSHVTEQQSLLSKTGFFLPTAVLTFKLDNSLCNIHYVFINGRASTIILCFNLQNIFAGRLELVNGSEGPWTWVYSVSILITEKLAIVYTFPKYSCISNQPTIINFE